MRRTKVKPQLELVGLRDGAGRSLFRLTEDYASHVGPGCSITVPKGYVTNFGTIPRWARWLVSPAEFAGSFITHDWLTGEVSSQVPLAEQSGYSRWFADALLFEQLTVTEGCQRWRATLIWAAVRLAAWWKGLR